MDKNEYLAQTYRRIEGIFGEESFRNNLSQVRARAVQTELASGSSRIGFTFDPKQIWRYCDYIFSEGSLLLRSQSGDKRQLMDWIRAVGENFEFLSKFADTDDREMLQLNAAMCYHIAGFQANARCMTRLVERQYFAEDFSDDGQDTPDGILAKRFRRALVAFLSRNIKTLRDITGDAITDTQKLQTPITNGISEGLYSVDDVFGLTAHAYYHHALSNFASYCVEGNLASIARARTNLEKSHSYFQKAGDATFDAVTSELRTVLAMFEERGTWSALAQYASHLLDSPLWKAYLRTLALDKSVVEFWQSQIMALRAGVLATDNSYVLQMPTSSGKTFIAELAMLAALSSAEQSRCLYIAPYRALVNEIESTLAGDLGPLGFHVSNLIGDYEFDAFQSYLARRAHVLVATPEKTNLLLRTHPEFFEQVALVVIDEGHIIDEGFPSVDDLDEGQTVMQWLTEQGTLGRGPILELLMTRLRKRFPSIRFMFMSAVMPDVNANDFKEWLCRPDQEILHISKEERPSRQVISMFNWISPENGEIEYVSLPNLPGENKSPFVPYFIRRKQYLTGELTPTGRKERQSWPKDINNKSQTTAMLAVRFAKTAPVLVFCAQPSHVRQVVSNILTSLKYLEASGELSDRFLGYVDRPSLDSYQVALEWLGKDHVLTEALHRRVGLHYGPLPAVVREAIEEDFRNERIRILVSTNTLAQGVNLPIKTAIIYGLERVWGNEDENAERTFKRAKVKKRDFWNICGRAGRAGKETEGQIVFVVTSSRDRQLFGEYRDETNLEQVNSVLYRVLEELVQRRIDQPDLIGLLDTHILGLLAEEVVDTQDEQAIKEFLGTSLVGVQAARNSLDLFPLASAFRQASAWVIDQVPAPLRSVFSATGLCVISCQIIDREVSLFLNSISDEGLLKAQDDPQINLELLAAAFIACRDLPEMRLKRTIDYGGPEDEFDLVKGWLEGRSVAELQELYWKAGDAESFSEYVTDRFSYKLPWGLNGFLRILATRLDRKLEDLPLSWQHLPSMVAYGVGNTIASWACSIGVSSRNLALQLADRYRSEQHVGFSDFLQWLYNLPAEYIIGQLDGSEYEKRRLLAIRDRIVPDDELLQFIRGGKTELKCYVTGVRYEERYLVAAQLREGDPVILVAEPQNPHDRHAVLVKYREQTVGYVRKNQARVISSQIATGRTAEAFVDSIRLGESEQLPQIELRVVIK
jgi:helicase